MSELERRVEELEDKVDALVEVVNTLMKASLPQDLYEKIENIAEHGEL